MIGWRGFEGGFVGKPNLTRAALSVRHVILFRAIP